MTFVTYMYFINSNHSKSDRCTMVRIFFHNVSLYSVTQSNHYTLQMLSLPTFSLLISYTGI